MLLLTFYRTSFPTVTFWLSLLIPPFNMASVIAQLAAMHMNCCSIIDGTCYWDKTLWTAGVWIPVIAGLIQASVVCVGLVWIERRDQKRVSNPSFEQCAWALDRIDADNVHSSVIAESERIMKGCDDNILFVKLWHSYPKSKEQTSDDLKWVVRDLSFGVRPRETLGLLGRNGAGKTTALSTLLGLNRQLAGYAGIWPGKTIGFCPQINSLWDGLSGMDHVRFYATLRGCWRGTAYGERILRKVGLEDMYKLCKSYSGGMKRRLCLAISFIGEPEVLILDEPTAGVDVAGKRDIWKIINRFRDRSSLIVTTHSLEEAEALASRVAIMDGGKLVQLDTTYELRKLHRKIKLNFDPPITDEALELLKQRIGSYGATSDSERTHIELDMSGISQALILEACCDVQRAGQCSHFTIQELSLEDIFLRTVPE